jgi:hypothetical protein
LRVLARAGVILPVRSLPSLPVGLDKIISLPRYGTHLSSVGSTVYLSRLLWDLLETQLSGGSVGIGGLSCLLCWNTAVVARPQSSSLGIGEAVVLDTAAVARTQSSSPGIGEAVVLECRSYRSRLPCVLDDGDLSSRLQITWRISKVLGFFEFTRLCIYMRPVSAPERASSSNSFYSMLRIQSLIFL